MVGPFESAVGAGKQICQWHMPNEFSEQMEDLPWGVSTMNMFGNPLVIIPKYVHTPSFQTSFMSTPCLFFRPILVRLKRHQLCLSYGYQYTHDPVKLSKPVASTTMSNSRSLSSAMSIPVGRKVLSGVWFRSTISTLGWSRTS